MKKRNKPVIPGFELSMGITISILSLVVLIPLASLVVYTAKLSFKDFIETITRARVLASFYTSFVCAFAAAVINGIMGTILAWVLVKYDFPGKRLMDGMIELPFALPTAVAGIALTSLTSDSGIVGSFFAGFGIKIAYTRIGITVAMIFVGIPFVVRSVQPVLEKMDNSYSEAAGVLGAKKTTIFWKVIFPELKPAIFAGTGLFPLLFGNTLPQNGEHKAKRHRKQHDGSRNKAVCLYRTGVFLRFRPGQIRVARFSCHNGCFGRCFFYIGFGGFTFRRLFTACRVFSLCSGRRARLSCHRRYGFFLTRDGHGVHCRFATFGRHGEFKIDCAAARAEIFAVHAHSAVLCRLGVENE